MKLETNSALPRFGVKGRAAGSWLESHSVSLPAMPNSWKPANQNRVLRLGRGEYLVEGDLALQLAAAWQAQPNIFLVPRYDAAFVLTGHEAATVLQEICALDTRPEIVQDQVLITLIAGISATLVCEDRNDEPYYRMWCDGTYADYMQEILTEIVLEQGGEVIGLQA